MTELGNTQYDATVLLVDDNPHNLKVLYETLKDRGYHLLVANDGEKALGLAERHQPEVILLDIMMPEMDGYEVCERLKANPATADGAVVFLSALDDVEAKVKGFSLGGADYIAKPFQPQEVIARVKTHARVVRLERELQARNRQLEGDQARILDTITQGIYGLDAEGAIVFANPAAASIIGCELPELVGQNFFAFHFGLTELAGLPVLETCQQGIAVHERGIEMMRQDRSLFPAEVQATPKREGDQLLGAVVMFRDISQELDSERALEEARTTVQEQRDQLAHVSRLLTMGEMAAGFAHEVNQPLTAISNYVRVALRLIAADPIDRELVSETLGKIEAQSHRASEVIRRIRGFVKKPATGKEDVDLAALLEETRQFAEVDARNNDGGIDIHITGELPAVAADPVQVQQVALNLIRNALEATREANTKAPVEVRAVLQDERTVRIEVLDRGIGLPEDAEQQLFLPFYTTKKEGMGIGLPLCQSLIKAQGGDIGFERRPEGGTCFYFTLPVAPAA
ncbi:MAG: response regulator [Marinobacter sp.]|nr:response regulator [Marinobacter sp.]